MNTNKHIQLLGHNVEDKVSKLKGVVTSISFDLFGCIQAVVNPGVDKDGKAQDSCWFDVNRLNVLSKNPVMDVPDFENGPHADGDKGPSDKPSSSRF